MTALYEEADLSHLNAYHGVWALSTINKKTGRLHATHYAWPVVYGAHPLWVVCTVAGNFVRYAGSRDQVAAAYPRLVWRRTMARWSLLSAANHSIPLRHEELADSFGKKVPRRLVVGEPDERSVDEVAEESLDKLLEKPVKDGADETLLKLVSSK